MNVVELIRKKRSGEELSTEELSYFIDGYTKGDIPDYQVSAFLMAVFFKGMSKTELGTWTRQMLHSGEVLDLSDIPGHKVDKHSTGGIGDKISLILAPLAVAAGLKVPMISGRGLGHTGGTLDKLESIPGFNVNLSIDAYRKQLADLGCTLIGQTGQIAPADKKLYALRDVTGTVECIPLIASSIMSKKLAEGIDALVLDVKVGSGAFMKNADDAEVLAKTMIEIGKEMGTPTRALMTDMNQPLGQAIGNAVEVAESIETLRGNGPKDVEDITVALVHEMLDLAGMADENTDQMLREKLRDGSAFTIFRDIVEAQGGDVATIDDPSLLPQPENRTFYKATTSGYVRFENVAGLGFAALELGAGRRKKEDDIDPAVGLLCLVRHGQKVDVGDSLFEILYNDPATLSPCENRITDAIVIQEDAPAALPLIYKKLV